MGGESLFVLYSVGDVLDPNPREMRRWQVARHGAWTKNTSKHPQTPLIWSSSQGSNSSNIVPMQAAQALGIPGSIWE